MASALPRAGPARPQAPATSPYLRPIADLPPSHARGASHVARAIAPSTPDVTLKRNAIGGSDLVVPEVCMGTMIFGSQVSEADSMKILDHAFDCGVNFLDTAEMYSVPVERATNGNSSKIVGKWMKGKRREDVAVATKVSGRTENMGYVRANRTEPPGEEGPMVVDRANIRAALEGELRRLGTDYVDLFQIHWPDRYVPLWGSSQYKPEMEYKTASFEEQAAAMGELIKEGKIRHWGVSNESTFGLISHCLAADAVGAPRPISTQNSYSITNRTFDSELAEACSPSNFNIGLLPYFALAAGALSGKYLDGANPKGSRFELYPSYLGRMKSDKMTAAVREYAQIAAEAGITPAQLAYSFVKSRWFVPSTIIGATSIEQLKQDLAAFGMDLSEDTLAAIEEVQQRCPNPQNLD
eukprot:evm.model.scf_3328.2 EVM.evm.TU.scf_3328.2   scf_3328:10469-13226(+)